MAIVNEVVTKFSFIGSLKPQETFNANLANSINLLGDMAAGIKKAAEGVFLWASKVNTSVATLGNLSSEIGVAAGRMQELGYAASQNGSSLDAVTGSLVGINNKVREFEQSGTGAAAEASASLGLSFRDAAGNIKKADQIFLELQDSMRGLSQAAKVNILDAFGIDQSLLRTMSLAGEEMDGLRARARALGVVTDEEVEAAKSFKGSLETLNFAMSGIQQTVAAGLAPVMKDLAERFVTALEANRDWIVNGLTLLGKAVSAAAGLIDRMWPVLLGIAGALAVANIAAIGFGTALGIAFSPVTLITAAIVAAVLVIDDLLVAMSGGKSVIADFFSEFFGIDIVPVLQGIVEAFNDMIDNLLYIFSPFVDTLKNLLKSVILLFIGDWEGAIEALKAAFSSFGEYISRLFTSTFNGLKGIWQNVAAYIKLMALALLPDWAVALIRKVTGGGDIEKAKADLKNTPMPEDVSALISGDAAVDMATRGNTNINSASTRQDVSIKIVTSDPQAAGAAVVNALDEQLENAQTMSVRGGR